VKKYDNGVPTWWLLVILGAMILGAMVGIWMVSSATNCGLTVAG